MIGWDSGLLTGRQVGCGIVDGAGEGARGDIYGSEEGFKFGLFLMTPSPPMTSLMYGDGGLDKI